MNPILWKFIRTLPSRFPASAHAPTLYSYDQNGMQYATDGRIPSPEEQAGIDAYNAYRGAMNQAQRQAFDNFIKDVLPLSPLVDPYTPFLDGTPVPMIHPVSAPWRTPFKLSEDSISPIVLDLDGDGVETTATFETGVYFDLDNTGYAEKTGWVGKDDGFLVRDINGNGQIDGGAELFGNHTLLQNGVDAANGFQALAELDGNHDGKVDASDAAFNTLRVWKDANSNGVTDENELLTMQQASITSLGVTYTVDSTVDIQGNEHRQLGEYTGSGGQVRSMTDVWFAVDTAQSIDLHPVFVDFSIAALPEVYGMGNVSSLRQTMAKDTTGKLAALVTQWKEGDWETRDATLLNLIYSWTGANSADPERWSINVPGDARMLVAMERVLGEDYLNQGEGSMIAGPAAGNAMIQAFCKFVDYVEQQLFIQTDFKDILDSIVVTFDAIGSGAQFDVTQTLLLLQAEFNSSQQGGSKPLRS